MVVVVAGGAGGIGGTIAQGFAQEGGMTIILDSTEEGAQKVAREIESNGGKASVAVVDATREDEVNNTIAGIVETYGRIDVLVNSIGLNKPMPFMETPESVWYRIIELNLMVTMRICKAVLPHMIKQKFGRIINLSSQQGRRGAPQAVPYAATKAAVISLTKSLALETAECNIRVNAVCPGVVDAGLTKQIMKNSPDYLVEMMPQTPMRRICQPEEISSVVMFLASDESSYMTGQSLSVDGVTIML